MDLRQRKTRKAIKEAFLKLHEKKPVEKITVKELAGIAQISKATFYLHYRDIYDLAEQLQKEGYITDCCYDGETALHYALNPEYGYDIVRPDLQRNCSRPSGHTAGLAGFCFRELVTP